MFAVLLRANRKNTLWNVCYLSSSKSVWGQWQRSRARTIWPSEARASEMGVSEVGSSEDGASGVEMSEDYASNSNASSSNALKGEDLNRNISKWNEPDSNSNRYLGMVYWENGLLRQVTFFVIHEVIRQTARWRYTVLLWNKLQRIRQQQHKQQKKF